MKLVLRNFVYFCVIHNALLINAMPTPAQYADRANQLMAAKSQNCPLSAEIYELHRDDFLTEPGVEIEMISRNDAKNQVAKIRGGLKVNFGSLWRLIKKYAPPVIKFLDLQQNLLLAWLPVVIHPIIPKIIPESTQHPFLRKILDSVRTSDQLVKDCLKGTGYVLGFACVCVTGYTIYCHSQSTETETQLRYVTGNHAESKTCTPMPTGGWLIKLPHHPLLRLKLAQIRLPAVDSLASDGVENNFESIFNLPKHPKWYRQCLGTNGQFKEDAFEFIDSPICDFRFHNDNQPWMILYVKGKYAFELLLREKNLFDLKFEFIMEPPRKPLQYKTFSNTVHPFPIVFQSFSEMLKTFERNDWTDPIHLPEPITPYDQEIIELISNLCLSTGLSNQLSRKSDSFKSRMLQLIDYFQLEDGLCAAPRPDLQEADFQARIEPLQEQI